MIDYEFMNEVSSKIEKAKEEKEEAEEMKRQDRKDLLQGFTFLVIFAILILFVGYVEGL